MRPFRFCVTSPIPISRSVLFSILGKERSGDAALNWFAENKLSPADLTALGVLSLCYIYLQRNDLKSVNPVLAQVCERANLKEALRQVKGNKGSAGVDRITVDQLGDYLKQHWPAIREQLLIGTYEPKPVRRVEIPKPDGGGVRKLGIPTHHA